MSTLLLETRALSKHYRLPARKELVRALDGVDLKLYSGRTVAIVGESGCGKSTLAKVLMRLEEETSGEILISGQPHTRIRRSQYLRTLQMIFQDPYSSINPRKKAWEIISEPLRIQEGLSANECRVRAMEWMIRVGLRPEFADRYPHMFSGGQRQRIGIARALILRPKILICDEPISALDVSIQAQVLNLLMDLQEEFQLALLFISHDLSVVKHIADEVHVMYLGKVVERGPTEKLFEAPSHPYTQALLSSTPEVGAKRLTERVPLRGEPPSPLSPPSGCRFHTRCPYTQSSCRTEVPALLMRSSHEDACHFSGRLIPSESSL
jgi:dipeptide transport system ATP-binding protein